MSWTTLSKEQQQYAILGGLVGTIVIYALLAFGLRPFLVSWGETRLEYEEVQANLEEAHKNVNRTSQVLLNLDSSYTNLTALAEEYVVPADNSYSWVTEKINQHARELGLDIESISEYPSNMPWSNSESLSREFGAYGVRLVTTCGYDQLRELVVTFEESNPLLAVSGFKISGSSSNFEQHRVQIYLEWPIWTNLKGKDIIRSSDLSSAKGTT